MLKYLHQVIGTRFSFVIPTEFPMGNSINFGWMTEEKQRAYIQLKGQIQDGARLFNALNTNKIILKSILAHGQPELE